VSLARHLRPTRLVATAAVTAALAAPASAAIPYQDLRSPDASNTEALPVEERGSKAATTYRSPASTAPAAQVGDGDSGGFDWGDAGIGAGSAVALLGLGAGSVVLAGSRRRRRRLAVPH
jgi:hypothetical protein